MLAARVGLPAVATIAMMLLWLIGWTLIEPSSASAAQAERLVRVRTRSATCGVLISRAAVSTPLVRPFDSRMTGSAVEGGVALRADEHVGLGLVLLRRRVRVHRRAADRDDDEGQNQQPVLAQRGEVAGSAFVLVPERECRFCHVTGMQAASSEVLPRV